MIKTKAKAPVVVKPLVRNVVVQPQKQPLQQQQQQQQPPPVKPRKPLQKYGDEVNNNLKKIVNGCINRTKIKIDAESSVNITSGSKMALLWNASGWIRVYLGTDRSDISLEDPNKMVHIASDASTYDVVKDMDIPEDYTLWVQTGGDHIRRLREDERPLMIQEEFLQSMGITEISRRARLGIDPDFKYILRFFIGPTEPPLCGHATRSGTVEILKGLVFPQWQRRSIAVIGSKLIIFPIHPGQSPDYYDLTGAGIFEHTPNYNRLIIKIVPSTRQSHKIDLEAMTTVNQVKSIEYLSHTNGGIRYRKMRQNNNNPEENLNEISVYNSGDNLVEEEEDFGSATRPVLFLGFEDSWERDLWSQWLIESTVDTSTPKRMDIANSGLCSIPEVVLKGVETIEELSAGQNQLQEIALTALSNFKNLKQLHLARNGFKKFPEPLLDCKGLVMLDLADNGIEVLPERICTLKKLEELRLDRNELTMLPNTLKDCRNLATLEVANNRLEKLPPFMLNVKQVQGNGKENGRNGLNLNRNKIDIMRFNENGQDENLNPPLTKVNLRANHLKGNIILGNYGFLTQLDVSENSIQTLDLSALDRLESLQCSRNTLSELVLNGRALKSLIAGNNKLKLLNVSPPPLHLSHLDISYNQLEKLPSWLSECHTIGTFFANNNQITALPDNFFHTSSDTLHTLQLGYNNISTLPSLPNRTLALRELFLQSNKIIDLPESFFIYCENLILLNVSSNKLLTLPILDHNRCLLERVYLTNNALTDRVLDTITYFTNLKVLHAAYNRITTLPEICVANWAEIEELVLAGNRLQHLPENMANLRHLRVLRVHSNQLQSVPALAKTQTLRVLDLAHNQLDKINLVTLVPKNLQFLDLSCNLQLQVDPKELQVCRSQRPMSLVDVSGKNRASLPATPIIKTGEKETDPPWQVGFSETPGCLSKLFISQLRLPSFCSSEGLFGLFDSEQSTVLPNIMVKCIPKILLEERTVKETAPDYMKYTMLSAHRELKQQGQKQGVCATLCHISRSKYNNNEIMSYYQNPAGGRRFILRTANVGDSEAVLVRQNGVVNLTKVTKNRKIGYSASYPIILPDPEVSEIALSDVDEYLIIANKKLWEVMNAESVAEECRKETNVILAAKRIQDIAQSYGAEENVSVLIVKFNNLGTDIDQLMRELRQTIRKKPPGTMISGFCKCGCCCESNNNCCHSGAMDPFIRQPSARSDRSSPSGQSDNTAIEGQTFSKQNGRESVVSVKKGNGYLTNERRSLRSGVARAVRARIEEEREREREETDSAISEEQFKCWEYMLEQNTQLLFDKELNTISKAFTKNPNSSLLRSQLKSLSASSPQLQDPSLPNKYHTVVARGANPFLSKQFGSTRSFHSSGQPPYRPNKLPLVKPPAPIPPGGPNAAYFGSIQRLMPYNLEYDFTPSIQERVMTLEDSLEEETDRMHHYWGVATTEL